MCYLVRHQHRAFEETDAAPAVPGERRFKPRWAFAAAGLAIGSIALGAAFVGPGSTPVTSAQGAAAPVPVAARNVADPSGGVAGGTIGQGSQPVDDEVPTAPATARASLGHCDQSL